MENLVLMCTKLRDCHSAYKASGYNVHQPSDCYSALKSSDYNVHQPSDCYSQCSGSGSFGPPGSGSVSQRLDTEPNS